MRAVQIPLVVAMAGAAVLVGCHPSRIAPGPINTIEAGDFSLTIETPKHDFLVGERFKVIVTARNDSGDPVEIRARSGAPVYLRLWRHTEAGWDETKRYPQAETMVMNPWMLEADSERRFVMILTAEPDWPTGELLKLTAELNGRPEVTPGVMIQIPASIESGT